jgi:hypothetical protein
LILLFRFLDLGFHISDHDDDDDGAGEGRAKTTDNPDDPRHARHV